MPGLRVSEATGANIDALGLERGRRAMPSSPPVCNMGNFALATSSEAWLTMPTR